MKNNNQKERKQVRLRYRHMRGTYQKAVQGTRGKVSYANIVVGKGLEAKQRNPIQTITQSQNILGGAQPANDHGARKGKKTLIQESAEDKLTGILPLDHTRNNGKIVSQLNTEGNLMAI
jgi:hypothetical protein